MARSSIFRTGPLGAGRLEAFSDGVIAVAITLLVLDVKLPVGLKDDVAIWAAVLHIAPVLLSWVVSFAFLLTIWVNHHYFMASLKGVDRGLLWLNGLFLLFVTLIPFPTGLVGEYPGLPTPLALLSVVMMATAACFAVMRFYATFHAGLLREHIDAKKARATLWPSVTSPILYGCAAGLAFVWPPGAIAIQVLVLAFFFAYSPVSLYSSGS